jgi:hypothetical protein
VALSAVVLALLAGCAPAAWAADGADVSYPQCGSAYPVGQAFGIVGVNGGRATSANPCLASELGWAVGSPGFEFAFLPRVALYINTGDPGPRYRQQRVASWPRAGRSPYGQCAGAWTRACAFIYGEQRAAYSYGLAAAVDSSIALDWPWWLDVETANSWATYRTAGFTGVNIAAIEGFVDGLRAVGALGMIGIYSTPNDWLLITGLSSAASRAVFQSEPDWIGGAATRLQALANCTTGFSGPRPVLAQYRAGALDTDIPCVASRPS